GRRAASCVLLRDRRIGPLAPVTTFVPPVRIVVTAGATRRPGDAAWPLAREGVERCRRLGPERRGRACAGRPASASTAGPSGSARRRRRIGTGAGTGTGTRTARRYPPAPREPRRQHPHAR